MTSRCETCAHYDPDCFQCRWPLNCTVEIPSWLEYTEDIEPDDITSCHAWVEKLEHHQDQAA